MEDAGPGLTPALSRRRSYNAYADGATDGCRRHPSGLLPGRVSVPLPRRLDLPELSTDLAVGEEVAVHVHIGVASTHSAHQVGELPGFDPLARGPHHVARGDGAYELGSRSRAGGLSATPAQEGDDPPGYAALAKGMWAAVGVPSTAN